MRLDKAQNFINIVWQRLDSIALASMQAGLHSIAKRKIIHCSIWWRSGTRDSFETIEFETVDSPFEL
jgi:hypothetical protein